MSDDGIEFFVNDGYYTRTTELRVLQRADGTWDLEQKWSRCSGTPNDVWRKVPIVAEPAEVPYLAEEVRRRLNDGDGA